MELDEEAMMNTFIGSQMDFQHLLSYTNYIRGHDVVMEGTEIHDVAYVGAVKGMDWKALYAVALAYWGPDVLEDDGFAKVFDEVLLDYQSKESTFFKPQIHIEAHVTYVNEKTNEEVGEKEWQEALSLQKQRGIKSYVKKHITVNYSLENEHEYTLDEYLKWFAQKYPDKVLSEDEIKAIHETYAKDYHADYKVWLERLETGKGIAKVAKEQLGDRYWWGAEGPDYFDCSGLVYYAFEKNGLDVDRMTADWYGNHGELIGSLDDLQVGDVIAIGKSHDLYTHIGIYIGDDKVIHAGGGDENTFGDVWYARVKINSLDSFVSGEKSCYQVRRYF